MLAAKIQGDSTNLADSAFSLPIEGMTCASCVARIERSLNKVEGVQSVNVNLATERADIQASLTAPHGPEGPVYPGTCRALGAEEQTHRIAAGKAHAWRIDMAQATARAGPLCWHAFGAEGSEVIAANPAVHGDVVLARKDAPASYHLSCTLDDAAMGVTHVLRGADLRHATDIHRLLQAVLDLPSPAYRHHPLLVDAQGRRLAKRSGSLSLAQLRTQGIDPRVLAADLRAGRFPVGISGGKA